MIIGFSARALPLEPRQSSLGALDDLARVGDDPGPTVLAGHDRGRNRLGDNVAKLRLSAQAI
jgi:hypothetical protein